MSSVGLVPIKPVPTKSYSLFSCCLLLSTREETGGASLINLFYKYKESLKGIKKTVKLGQNCFSFDVKSQRAVSGPNFRLLNRGAFEIIIGVSFNLKSLCSLR